MPRSGCKRFQSGGEGRVNQHIIILLRVVVAILRVLPTEGVFKPFTILVEFLMKLLRREL